MEMGVTLGLMLEKTCQQAITTQCDHYNNRVLHGGVASVGAHALGNKHF